MAFNDLVQAANSRVMSAVGEPARVTKISTGESMDDVMLVIDRDVEVYLGEVASIGHTVSYREAVTGKLSQKDTVTDSCGRVYELNRRLEGDGDMIARIAIAL